MLNRKQDGGCENCDLQKRLHDSSKEYDSIYEIDTVSPQEVYTQFKNRYNLKVIGNTIYFIENGLYRKESENEVAAKTYVILSYEMTKMLKTAFFESDSGYMEVRERLLTDAQLQFDTSTYYLVPIDDEYYFCAKRLPDINYDVILLPDSAGKTSLRKAGSNHDEVLEFVKSNYELTNDDSFYTTRSGYNLYHQSGGLFSYTIFSRHFRPVITEIFGDLMPHQGRKKVDKSNKTSKRGVIGIREKSSKTD